MRVVAEAASPFKIAINPGQNHTEFRFQILLQISFKIPYVNGPYTNSPKNGKHKKPRKIHSIYLSIDTVDQLL